MFKSIITAAAIALTIGAAQAALTMRLSYDGTEIDKLKLTGSRSAWNEVERCQKEMTHRPPSGGPFSTSGGNEDDPFGTGGNGKKSSAKNS